VQSQVIGTGAFQEVDLVQAFDAVADFNHRVLPNSKHSELMLLAIKHAIINREVSHLTFPDDMQKSPVGDNTTIKKLDNRIASSEITPPRAVVEDAIKRLSDAKRPVIIVGHGARFNMDQVLELAEKLNAPVLTTFKAKGLISDSHSLGCGVLGRSGTPIASWVMNEADLICVFGASFSNHTGIASKIPTIQVDFDRLVIAKFHDIELPVWGEIGITAKLFSDGISNSKAIDQRPDIANRWKLWKAEKENRLKDDKGNGISSISVFEAMNRLAPINAVMCVDVGNNAYSFGRYFETKNHSFIMSGYLGSIGFGYPAAMGAVMAVKGSRPVIAVTGDGGFAQYMAEVTTAVKYKMPIKHILINNGELGKISKEQRADQLDVWQTSLSNPNYADFATSCGALGIRVESLDQLDAAMKKVLAHNGPAMLEVMADVNLI
jgi:pyruvate oxidase